MSVNFISTWAFSLPALSCLQVIILCISTPYFHALPFQGNLKTCTSNDRTNARSTKVRTSYDNKSLFKNYSRKAINFLCCVMLPYVGSKNEASKLLNANLLLFTLIHFKSAIPLDTKLYIITIVINWTV